MAAPTEADIIKSLQTIRDPVSGKNVVEAGLIEGLALRGGHVSFAVEVAPERGPASEPLRKACEDAVSRLPGVLSVTAVLTAHRERNARSPRPAARPHAHDHAHSHAPAEPSGAKGVAGVGSIIAVASGKGGVGKSTVAVNLALGLAALGLKTGLLDADIYGPSVPRLLDIKDKPRSDGKKLSPIEKFGLKAMSIGFLVDEDKPMIWRGPMVQSAITQMLGDVEWAPLDVLVVDMPPGTGDAQLTLAQRETAARLGVDFLGEIPLVQAIRETSDAGTPIVAQAPNGPEARAFLALAQKVAEKLSARAERSAPKIVIE